MLHLLLLLSKTKTKRVCNSLTDSLTGISTHIAKQIFMFINYLTVAQL